MPVPKSANDKLTRVAVGADKPLISVMPPRMTELEPLTAPT